MLGMDIKHPELPPPTLNLGHQKEQARLDKEDRERQAREREARGAIEALLDKRDEEAKQQRIRQREAMVAAEAAAAEAAAASQPRTAPAAARASVTATAAASAVAPIASHPAPAHAPVVPPPAPPAAAQRSLWDEEARRALQPMGPMVARPGAAQGWETGWDLPCTAAPLRPLQRRLYHALGEEAAARRAEECALALQARARGRAVRREREEAQRLQRFAYYLGQGQAASASTEPTNPTGVPPPSLPASLPPGTTSWYEAALELATSTAEQAQVAAALRDATGGGAPRRYICLGAPGAATGGFALDDFDLCPDCGEGSELGEGWRQIDDPEAGRYFFNFRTGESVWERAQTGVAAPPLASAQEAVLATAAIRLQACARGRAARQKGASLRVASRAAVRLQACARGRAVRATPAATHVPSMPLWRPSLDVRLQESVRSEEGRPPAVAAPLAGRLATPESVQQQAHLPPRESPAQVQRPPSPEPSGQPPQPQPQPQPQPTGEAAKLAERTDQVDAPAPASAPTSAPAPAPAPSKVVKTVSFADRANRADRAVA